MIQQQVPPETAVGIALANPMQVFRTGTMMLFDPQLVLLGPAAYVILDTFGSTGYMIYALIYPAALGSLMAWIGYIVFRHGDLL
jgi:ABC-2 type transport system permease protein